MKRASWLVGVGLLAAGIVGPWLIARVTFAAEEPRAPVPSAAGGPVTVVSAQQERVTRLMDDLEQKFVRLAKALETSEPEQAARLLDALRRSKQALIRNRME